MTALKLFLRDIRVEHTLFALPFAYVGAVMAARGVPAWWQLLWITLAVIGARTAAMAANRYFDKEMDAANPRTAARPVASGKLPSQLKARRHLVLSEFFALQLAVAAQRAQHSAQPGRALKVVRTSSWSLEALRDEAHLSTVERLRIDLVVYKRSQDCPGTAAGCRPTPR